MREGCEKAKGEVRRSGNREVQKRTQQVGTSGEEEAS